MHPTNPRSILAPLCALALAAACGDGGAPLVAEATPVLRRPRPDDDPATATTYVPCVDAGTYGGAPAVIRYPRGANCLSSVPGSPLVLMMHGTGYPHNSYDYMLDHLAANGFIVVSTAELPLLDQDSKYEESAEVIEDVLADVLDDWYLASYIDPTRLALLGHSKGGKLARYVADRLKGDDDPWTVRALVSLSGNGGALPITSAITPALLIVQAAEDSDVEPNHNYQVYDHAGSDGLTKAMKLIEGGHHHMFSQVLGLHDMAHVAKGYTLAFLAAHVQGDWTWYDDYIRGDDVPHGWPGRVVGQYSDGVDRDVIDDFEDNLVGASAMDGAVTVTNASATIAHLELAGDEYQGETLALRVSGHAEGGSITWYIPEEHRDTGDFRDLSFRIGHVSGAAISDMRFQISNDGVWSAEKPIVGYGEIPTAMQMCPPSNALNGPGWACITESFHHMGTMRIPLADFGDHDDIDHVRLVFRGNSLHNIYLLDSLEFSGNDAIQWVFN